MGPGRGDRDPVVPRGLDHLLGRPALRPKRDRNRLRLELAPEPGSDQATEVARLLALGASYVGSAGELSGPVELLDPEGNELVVLG